MTTLHFAPTRQRIAIKKESVSGKIHNVGNTVIDSLLFLKKLRKTLNILNNTIRRC